MADCVIMDGMKEYALTKMYESTFDSEELLHEFEEHDYKMLGDEEAFMVYYKIECVFWVHFLWAKNKRKMYRVLKEFEKTAPPSENIILFDCDDIAKMFRNHSSKVYVWTKELK